MMGGWLAMHIMSYGTKEQVEVSGWPPISFQLLLDPHGARSAPVISILLASNQHAGASIKLASSTIILGIADKNIKTSYTAD